MLTVSQWALKHIRSKTTNELLANSFDSPIILYLLNFLLKGSSMPQRGCLITSRVASSNSPVGGRSFTLWKALETKQTSANSFESTRKAAYIPLHCIYPFSRTSCRCHMYWHLFDACSCLFFPLKSHKSILPESFNDLLHVVRVLWISRVIQVAKLPQICLCRKRGRQWSSHTLTRTLQSYLEFTI